MLLFKELKCYYAKRKKINVMSKNEYPKSPRVGVGAIVFKDGNVLLIRRGQTPLKGLWSIPGGNLELGESLQKGVEREIFEETGVTINAGEPVYTFDLIEYDDMGRIKFHYVIVDLIADYVKGEIQAGDDAIDARWVSPQEIEKLKMSQRTVELLKRHFSFGL